MALLELLTGRAALWAGGAVLATVCALLGVQTLRLAQARASLATEQRDRAADRARMEEAAFRQAERFRATEHEWNEAQRKAVDAAEQKAVQARADAVLADVASGRLQQRIATLAADARRAAANSPAARASAPTEDAAGMLAELQRRADERAGILARIADERGTAGDLCERSYDALMAP
jgi:hypothetical protein